MTTASRDKEISDKLANAIIYFDIEEARRVLAQPETVEFLKREIVDPAGKIEKNTRQLARLVKHEAELRRRRGADERADLIEEIGDLIEVAENDGKEICIVHGQSYVTKEIGFDGIVVTQIRDLSGKSISGPDRRENIPVAEAVVVPLRPREEAGFSAGRFRRDYGQDM